MNGLFFILFNIIIIFKSFETMSVNLNINPSFKKGDELLVNCTIANNASEKINLITLQKDKIVFYTYNDTRTNVTKLKGSVSSFEVLGPGKVRIKNADSLVQGNYLCNVSFLINNKVDYKSSVVKNLPFWNGTITSAGLHIINDKKNNSYIVECNSTISTDDYFVYLWKDTNVLYQYNKKRNINVTIDIKGLTAKWIPGNPQAVRIINSQRDTKSVYKCDIDISFGGGLWYNTSLSPNGAKILNMSVIFMVLMLICSLNHMFR